MVQRLFHDVRFLQIWLQTRLPAKHSTTRLVSKTATFAIQQEDLQEHISDAEYLSQEACPKATIHTYIYIQRKITATMSGGKTAILFVAGLMILAIAGIALYVLLSNPRASSHGRAAVDS